MEEELVRDNSLSHLSRNSFIVLVNLEGNDPLKGSHRYVISKREGSKSVFCYNLKDVYMAGFFDIL